MYNIIMELDRFDVANLKTILAQQSRLYKTVERKRSIRASEKIAWLCDIEAEMDTLKKILRHTEEY